MAVGTPVCIPIQIGSYNDCFTMDLSTLAGGIPRKIFLRDLWQLFANRTRSKKTDNVHQIPIPTNKAILQHLGTHR